MASTPGFEPGPHSVGGKCSHHCAFLDPQLTMQAIRPRISGSLTPCMFSLYAIQSYLNNGSPVPLGAIDLNYAPFTSKLKHI